MWREPDHYAWMLGYLRTRGLATRVRVLIAVGSMSYMVLPLSMLYSPAGPHGRWARGMVLIATGSVLLSAGALAWRWTSRRVSIIRTAIATLDIAVVCLSYTDPALALVGATTFAMAGSYIALFHSLRLQVVNLAVGLLTTTILALRALHHTHDVIATLNVTLVVAAAILALPITAHVLAHFLGSDLDTSDTDPLTGLLNRRAFYRATHRLLARHPLTGQLTGSPGDYLTVLMIDLDDFKNLNDTHGHRAGDTALITISALLTTHTPERAVVARIGGEEFLIADLIDPDTAHRCALDLCAAIARTHLHATGLAVTASIGLATTALSLPSTVDDHDLIEGLIDCADTAMYTAKHAGGNRTHTHQ